MLDREMLHQFSGDVFSKGKKRQQIFKNEKKNSSRKKIIQPESTGLVFSPGDDEIDRMRRQRAEKEFYKNRHSPINIERFQQQQQRLKKPAATATTRPASAAALTPSRVEVDARLARERGQLGPADPARREANAAALRANYELARAALKSKSDT